MIITLRVRKACSISIAIILGYLECKFLEIDKVLANVTFGRLLHRNMVHNVQKYFRLAF